MALLKLDRWDKAVSAPLHQLQLPWSLELLLSVPGNFFGLPAFLPIGAAGLDLVCGSPTAARVVRHITDSTAAGNALA